MGELGRKIRRAVIGLYLAALHIALAFFALVYFYPEFTFLRTTPIADIASPEISTPVPTPLPVPSEFADQIAEPSPSPQHAVPPDVLTIPVKGVRRGDLLDTFTSTRGELRSHGAIDIAAPAGTPVLAAADGRILKFHDSEAGGTTIYQISWDGKRIFYYAHLQRRADDLKEGDTVTRGRTIGYVGDTGNAGAGNFHLHFAVMEAPDPARFSSGTPVNPYPLLLNGIETQ